MYQRVSQPLTSPYPLEDRVQKAGVALEKWLEQADLASMRTEYAVRTGKPFVELILAGRHFSPNCHRVTMYRGTCMVPSAARLPKSSAKQQRVKLTLSSSVLMAQQVSPICSSAVWQRKSSLSRIAQYSPCVQRHSKHSYCDLRAGGCGEDQGFHNHHF